MPPISVCVSSSTKRYHQMLALMGATRLASGYFSAVSSRIFQQPRDASPHCVATQWGDVVRKPTCCGAMCATCAAATIGRAAIRNCGTASKMGAA